tara:strand:- start:1590 stop:1760 length:171 start_codon:yes stop_codon:yes gene_type:complete
MSCGRSSISDSEESSLGKKSLLFSASSAIDEAQALMRQVFDEIYSFVMFFFSANTW